MLKNSRSEYGEFLKRGRIFFVVFLIVLCGESAAQFESNPLSQAVDDPKNNYVSEAPSFFRQTEISNVGGDAAQSADIGSDEISAMAVEIDGPATVTFDWKVSSESDFDFLTASIIDSGLNVIGEVKRISGERDWSSERLNVPEGKFAVVWAYVKDFSDSEGLDTGWVDNVVIRKASTNESLSIAPIVSLILDENTLPEVPDIANLYPPIAPLTNDDGKFVLRVESEAGEQIGAGRNYYIDQSNANFTVNEATFVGLDLVGHSLEPNVEFNRWSFFMRPEFARYLPGTYRVDTPATGTTDAFLSIRSLNTSLSMCSDVTGEFRIYEIDRTQAGELLKLTADAVARCQGAMETIRISLRYDKSVKDLDYTQPIPENPAPTPALPELVGSGANFKLLNLDTMELVEYDSSSANIVASNFMFFNELGRVSPQLSFSVKSLETSETLHSGFFSKGTLDIDTNQEEPFGVGSYPLVTNFFTRTLPRIDLSGIDGCTQSDIESVNIYDIEYSNRIVLESISMDFTCGRFVGSLNYRK